MKIAEEGWRVESSRAVVRPMTPAPRIRKVGLDILENRKTYELDTSEEFKGQYFCTYVYPLGLGMQCDIGTL